MEFPGENLLIKMWETLIEKGVGGLIMPYYIPWKNKKLALGQIELDKIIEAATTNAEKEIIQISNNQTLLIEQDQPKINYNNLSQSISVQDIVIKSNEKRLLRKEVNVTKSIGYASQRLINDNSEPPDYEINDDWLNTWRENASKVSDEEVQSLWGNVLAQEFLEPGRYSLRLLEFLKTMSKEDALLIEKLAPYTSELGVIYGYSNEQPQFTSNNKFLDASGLNSSQISLLEEIGIISGVSTLGMTRQINNIRKQGEVGYLSFIYLSNNKVLMFSNQKLSKNIGFVYYEITKIGREILSLISYEVKPQHVEWLVSQLESTYQITMCEKIDNGFIPRHHFNM